jgi:hypothetical protein
LKIDIIINDPNGNTIAHGYRLANRLSVGEAMLQVFEPEFSRAMDALSAKFQELVDKMKASAVSLTDNPNEIAAINAQFAEVRTELDEQTAGMLQARVNHAVQTQLTDEWPTFLPPGRFTAMAIETTRPEYTPHVIMRFQDASNYIWERTDTEGPKRIHEPRP